MEYVVINKNKKSPSHRKKKKRIFLNFPVLFRVFEILNMEYFDSFAIFKWECNFKTITDSEKCVEIKVLEMAT